MSSEEIKIDYPKVNGTMIISAFPCTGKTTYTYADYAPENFALDSDSSKFDKAYFPHNYMENIMKNIGKYSRLFVSSHKEVRTALKSNGLPFILIYPSMSLREEYLERCKKRGSNETLIRAISDNWFKWLMEIEQQTGCIHIELKSGQFISNVI